MKKIFPSILIIFLSLILTLPLFCADVISVNSGGDKGLVINSNSFLEGFFDNTACASKTCAELGYECGSWDLGCKISEDCGVCLSGYECNSLGKCVEEGTSQGEGGGGGGSGGLSPIADTGECKIDIYPPIFDIIISFNEITQMAQRVYKDLLLTNDCNKSKTLNIEIPENLKELIILEKSSITLAPGESESLRISFIAPLKEGTFNGVLLFNDVDEIKVNVKVTKNPLWFDANIVVLNNDYQVSKGSQLNTKVELVPMGDNNRMDVTLNYEIKDYNGTVFLKKQETLLVDSRIEVNRNFDTGMLPLGKYVVNLELVYPGGIAPSSAHFEIVPRSAEDLFRVILFSLVIVIVFIIIVIIIFLIIKKKRRLEEIKLFEK